MCTRSPRLASGNSPDVQTGVFLLLARPQRYRIWQFLSAKFGRKLKKKTFFGEEVGQGWKMCNLLDIEFRKDFGVGSAPKLK